MKNIYREYFYIPKDKHMTTKVFTTHVVLSVVSVLACTLAMFASSYAWFSTEISSGNNVIISGDHSLWVDDQKNTTEQVDEGVSVALLTAWDKHLFHIYPQGSASTGYCRVTLSYDGEDKVFYTEQIADDEYLVLALETTVGTEITFESFWGELEYHDRRDWTGLRYGAVYEQERAATFSLLSSEEEEELEELDPGRSIRGPRTPSKEYQFPQYGTLEDIAAFYEIEVEDILIFNGIEDAEEVEIGDWLDLPFVDEDAEDYEPIPPDIEHIVEEGETIESIAELYDVSIEELIEYNELEPVEIEDELPAEEEEEEEAGAVEPGVPFEQPEEEAEEEEEVEEEPAFVEVEEIDINELYPLEPGDVIWIPFEATSGYTPSTAVNEKDMPAVEPGMGAPVRDQNSFDKDGEETEQTGGILSSENDESQREKDGQDEPATEPGTGGLLVIVDENTPLPEELSENTTGEDLSEEPGEEQPEESVEDLPEEPVEEQPVGILAPTN